MFVGLPLHKKLAQWDCVRKRPISRCATEFEALNERKISFQWAFRLLRLAKYMCHGQHLLYLLWTLNQSLPCFCVISRVFYTTIDFICSHMDASPQQACKKVPGAESVKEHVGSLTEHGVAIHDVSNLAPCVPDKDEGVRIQTMHRD